MSLGKGVGVKVEIIVTGDELNELNKNCVIHIPKPLTNEEWFNGLATEEKAKRIINIAVNSDCDYRTIVEWLKQPHRNKE